MTQKLFDTLPYDSEFDAEVLSSEKRNGVYETVLSKTLFFAEGGGQYADTGTLDGVRVTDVQSENGVFVHYCEKELPVGKTVHGVIDFKKRFRNMQNHTGEHIVSGIISKLYGYDNVGFHLGHTDVTVDYNGILSEEDIRKTERLANEAVYKNIETKCYYPDEQELKTLNYRSKLELTENVRIVIIPGYDVCACCAPHVRTTGEIGIIKLLDCEKYKGGVRIHLLCGSDAVRDYEQRYESSKRISGLLKVPQDKIADAVEKKLSEILSLKAELLEAKTAVIKEKLNAVEPAEKTLCLFCDGLDGDTLLKLTDLAAKKCRGICFCLTGDDTAGYNFCLLFNGNPAGDTRERLKTELSASCGGDDVMLRGRIKAARKQIEDFAEQL